jgi:anaerobic ribonucleoside-triphosphate reductase
MKGTKSILAQNVRYTHGRVVGYLRPVSQWNDGKQAEYKERKVTHLNEK